MTLNEALRNIPRGKCIPYRKDTFTAIHNVVNSLVDYDTKALTIQSLSGLSLDNIIDLLKQGYVFTKPEKQEINLAEAIEKYNGGKNG